jgi:hypothetical protein
MDVHGPSLPKWGRRLVSFELRMLRRSAGEADRPHVSARVRRIRHGRGGSERAGARRRAPLWHTFVPGYVISSPAIGSERTVYVGAFDSKLYALDPVSGKVRWSFRTTDHMLAA